MTVGAREAGNDVDAVAPHELADLRPATVTLLQAEYGVAPVRAPALRHLSHLPRAKDRGRSISMRPVLDCDAGGTLARISASSSAPSRVVLPAQPTPFVGRADEVQEVESLLRQSDPRLLTLVGAGGTGKTRLAIEAATRAADAFPDGVYFVDLAPLADEGLVLPTIARSLGVQEEPDHPLGEALQHHLGSRTVLLLLDNFEQLLPAAPRLAELLQIAPTVKMLLTSRSALNLRWEQQFPV